MSTREDFINHPIETLEKALHIRKQIDALREGLTALFTGYPPASAAAQLVSSRRKGKRTMSAAARAKIAAAQRLRWARSKGLESATLAAPVKPAPLSRARKPGLSAEGRARIIAGQKARWAKVKAQKSKLAPAKAARKKKRHLSPEARARIVAAVKARWARFEKTRK